MKLLSLNVGKPGNYDWVGKVVRTSIFKSPVRGKRKVSFLNVEGDEQSDLNVHGGRDKAVYAYDVSNYEHWKKLLYRSEWPYGLFGENLTTEGLPDEAVRIGDIYRIGTVKLQVIQPRFPCTKLNLRFELPDMMDRFMQEKRNGAYFKVVEEGFLQATDNIDLIEPSHYGVSIRDYVSCYYTKGADKNLLTSLLSIPIIPQRHRTVFEGFL